MIRKRANGKREVQAYNPALGRKVYIGTYETLREAREAERKAAERFASRRHAQVGTVKAWAARWLKEHPRAEHTTNEHNRANLQPFLKEYGDRRLDQITKAEAKRLAEQRPHVARTASAMYNDAIRYLEGYQAANPFAKIVIQGKGRQNITPLSEAEVERLAEIAVQEHGWYGGSFGALIVFAAWTGCRPGELAALRRTDLDFESGTVLIERQRRVDGLHAPKTKRSRLIEMPDRAARAVHGLQVRHSEWVFTTSQGKQHGKGSWNYYWRPVRAAFEAELPRTHWLPRRLELAPADHLDLYELRHFCGSLLADQGLTARDIAKQLGNSAEVCERVYVHLHEDRAQLRIREAFRRATVQQQGSSAREGRIMEVEQR